MKLNINNKYVLSASDRSNVAVHKNTLQDLKDYAGLHDMTITEAVEQLLRESLNKTKKKS
jgi:hypothetical protein